MVYAKDLVTIELRRFAKHSNTFFRADARYTFTNSQTTDKLLVSFSCNIHKSNIENGTVVLFSITSCYCYIDHV